MKKLIFSATLILSLALAGCGDTEKEDLGGTVTNSPEDNESVDTDTTEAPEEEEEKIDQIIVDNENYTATLLEIVKKNDEIFGESIEVIFEIENKLDETIGVQARSVSADGYMIDETILSMSQEIAAGKKAKAVLTINDFDDYDFPVMEEDFEMDLYIFNYDSFDEIATHEVKVSF